MRVNDVAGDRCASLTGGAPLTRAGTGGQGTHARHELPRVPRGVERGKGVGAEVCGGRYHDGVNGGAWHILLVASPIAF